MEDGVPAGQTEGELVLVNQSAPRKRSGKARGQGRATRVEASTDPSARGKEDHLWAKGVIGEGRRIGKDLDPTEGLCHIELSR